MQCLWCILLVSIVPKWSTQVELSMKGTVNLGQDVVDVLAQYIKKKKEDVAVSGRRSYSNREQSDDEAGTIARVVSSAQLCRDLEICKGELDVFVNNYITMLAEGIESIFEGLIDEINENNTKNTKNVIIFEEGLKEILNEIKKLIGDANADKNDVTYTWISLTKKISAKCLDQAKIFASERLEGDADEVLEVKKHLTQKIVIVISLIELKFENTLCHHHDICTKSYICTKTLNQVLDHLETASDGNKLSMFIKFFQEALTGTNFYEKLNDVTAREFESILSNMSGTDNDLAKNIVAAIHKSVEGRQNLVATKFATNDELGRDVKLVHIILSDMDFFYSKEKNPFQDFLADLNDWLEDGGRFGSSLRRLMRDLEYKLSSAPKDLVMKLIDEVKVFMEITIDSAA